MYLVLDTVPRLLIHRFHEHGSNVLLASATSWIPDSTTYHVGVLPSYVLRPKRQEDIKVTLRFSPIQPTNHRQPLRFSGAGKEQAENLRLMVAALATKNESGLSSLERAARAMRTAQERVRKCALIVNSYEQVQLVVEQIAHSNPSLAAKTRGIVKTIPAGYDSKSRYFLRGQVETLGYEDDVLVIVFPLYALGRGVNIIFSTDDDDNGAAAIGSVYFLTRPHPVAGDLSLMLATIARATEEFDKKSYSSWSLSKINTAYSSYRRTLHERVMALLSRPLSASLLPTDFLPVFSANLLIPILQMIGRAIRKSQPAEIYFVDAAWASESAQGKDDQIRTSVLLTMRELLRKYLNEPDIAQRALLESLYGPFAHAFEEIEGLKEDVILSGEQDEGDIYTLSTLEDSDELEGY